MSLRKSPTRTPAFLAANRANAQKCAGPRTREGKARVARNALRLGLHAWSFTSLLGKSRRALDAALLPEETEVELVMGTVLRVWALKLGLMRWAASPQEREEWFAQSGGVCPAPLQLLIKRPGWKVRVSVYLRWGRGRGGHWWEPGPGLERAAGKAARRGDGDGLHGTPAGRLLPVGGGLARDSAAGALRNKTGMCKKTRG